MEKAEFSEDIPELNSVISNEYCLTFFNQLWEKGLPYGPWKDKNEYGCWVYQKNNDYYCEEMIYNKDKKRNNVSCNFPRNIKEYKLIAWFHTHIFGNGWINGYYDGPYDIRPSKGDIIFCLIHNIPGIVYTHEGYALFKGRLSQ